MNHILKNTLSNPASVSAGVFLVSGGALVFALVMQYMFGLQPCELCIWQRVPFVITGTLGLLGLITAYNPDRLKMTAFLVFLAGVAFVAGTVIAIYHTGVEQRWWRSFLEGCKVALPQDPADFLKFIETSKAVPCDQIPWKFLGLSMAAWNALMSPVLALGSFAASIMLARRANNFL